VNFIYHKF